MNSTIKNHTKKTLNRLDTLTEVDLLIVGAGVAGLELAHQVNSKWKGNKSILLVDQADYVGGRVRTVTDTYKNKKISFEAGAARFNKHHKSLISVIKRCGLSDKIIKIPSYWEFRATNKYKKEREKVPFKDIEELLKALIDHYDKPKHRKYLKGVTLFEACRDLFGLSAAKFLKHSYGYYSEIHVFNGNNAIRSLKNDLSETNQFFMLKNGLAQVPVCQATQFVSNKNCFLSLKTQVGSWRFNTNTNQFEVNLLDLENSVKHKIVCNNLVLATDGKQIKRWRTQLKTINPKILEVASHVTSQPLLRTYVIYDSKWFKNYGKVVTDGLVKYIIPIDYSTGLIMISYTDGVYANRMVKHINEGTQLEAIYESLKEIFPDDEIEKKPKYIRNEYWDTGAVYWNRGADSKKMSKFMMKPSKSHNLFICGDSFSENQAWTDGAIFNAREVSKLIK